MFPRLVAALAAYALMQVPSFAEECPNYQYGARLRAQKVVASGVPTMAENGQTATTNNSGSGVALTDNFILTNYHVVEGAKKLHIPQASGTTPQATLVKHDALLDLALLKLEAPLIPVLRPMRVAPSTAQVDDLYQLWSKNQERWLAGQVVRLPYMESLAGHEPFFYTQLSGLRGDSGSALYNCKGEVMGLVKGIRLRKLSSSPVTEAETARLHHLYITLNIGLYGGSTAGIDAFSYMSLNLRTEAVRPEAIRSFVCTYNHTLFTNCPAPPVNLNESGQVSARTPK